MDVWRITVAALRRWYVLLPLLCLTVAGALFAGNGVQQEYEVTGASMVVPGRAVESVPNPYGGPAEANSAVGIVVGSPETRAAVADLGLVDTYELSPHSRSTIMDVLIRSTSEQVAIDTGVEVFRLAAAELDQRQATAGIPPSQRYSIAVLQAPSVSATVADGKKRNMAVIGLLGGALSLAAAVFFDDLVGILRRRHRRNDGGAAKSDSAERERGSSTDTPEGRPSAGETSTGDASAGDRGADRASGRASDRASDRTSNRTADRAATPSSR